MRRNILLGSSALIAIGALVLGTRPAPQPSSSPADVAPRAPSSAPVASCEDGSKSAVGEGAEGEEGGPRSFRVPSGEPSNLTCAMARALIAEAQRELAHQPEHVSPRVFSDGVADWLDPHGLWSAAPDTPVARFLGSHGSELLREVESSSQNECPSAREAGRVLAGWNDELRAIFDAERNVRSPVAEGAAHGAASETVFETGSVSRPARSLAKALGRTLGDFEAEVGAPAAAYVDSARSRYFPTLDADAWAKVVLASEVRAYIPLIDPHGAWAPPDEEASVYEIDLEAKAPGHLWEKSTRTGVGIRVDSGATAPLEIGDVVLSLGGVKTAGLPMEQIDQLELAIAEARAASEIVVIRKGESTIRTLSLEGSKVAAEAAPEEDLPTTRVRYGSGDVIVVAIADVKDDLGPSLTRTILKERAREHGSLLGVVLDLRGNGGGSTDGAIAALGLFMPGVPLFPMKRRDGTIETDRAPEPPNVDRWMGPVATLVDSDTASAAEMIAGAIAAYRRGPILGSTTFGKGCAQEYIEDDPSAGVLRLTTLLYALPDGLPVQRVGLAPTIRLPMHHDGLTGRTESEASLPHAPPSWRGPDVRNLEAMKHGTDGTWTTQWPAHAGMVGPCVDVDVCRALRAVGTTTTSKASKRPTSSKGRPSDEATSK